MNWLANLYHAVERLMEPKPVELIRLKYVVIRASLAALVGSSIEKTIEVDTPEEAQSWIDHQPKPAENELADYAIYECQYKLYKGNRNFWDNVVW